jgi:hypothetical protein
MTLHGHARTTEAGGVRKGGRTEIDPAEVRRPREAGELAGFTHELGWR